jgi:hypothetical protein
MSPQSIRIVVVLPDPLGPSSPNTSPRWIVRIERVHRDERAEHLAQLLRPDSGPIACVMRLDGPRHRCDLTHGERRPRTSCRS